MSCYAIVRPLHRSLLITTPPLAARPHKLASFHSSIPHHGPPSVKHQLLRMAELQQKVSAVNSKSQKEHIISTFPDLRELLEQMYHPKHRTHLASGSMRKYISAYPLPCSHKALPRSLNQLFDLLASRQVTGNKAKDIVWAFLQENSVGTNGHLYETFERLLDRNLVAGFGANTLKNIDWGDQLPQMRPIRSTATTPPPLQTDIPPVASPAPSSTPTSRPPKKSHSLEKFTCALGKSIEPPFKELAKFPRWYASRKLDGVRVITFVDFLLPPSGKPQVISTQFLSRNGNPFNALSKLAAELEHLISFPQLTDWLSHDPVVIEDRGEEGVVKRLVLDGEVCILRPRAEGVKGEGEVDYVEDFQSVVGEVRRLGHDIENPAYFLFDVIPFAEFEAGTALPAPLGKTFGERVEDIIALVSYLKERTGGGVVRELEQWEVNGKEDVEDKVGRAAERGWEGLIIRADKPYNGKRSSDLRKFKRWQDAEYVVKSIDTGKMRLAVDGVFGEHLACANVWIEHKGTPVSVGSGFSAEQRLAYAKDPELIVGKEITVEYFSESEATDRPGKMSLRFPRVKAVYDGKRDI
ncbi:hypothetical protein M231_03837 [Tremella mesenterica]|uniref:ATP-dependent DNA ligase family profile domain-containing protein n=1 Tax=Tremella mesenterica TaxID=5217 RepID=A0A4Q1BM46_TREME|nr:hypothetical protein M231_03837 [Tremella mesenterica]